jgi:hypothetical protein
MAIVRGLEDRSDPVSIETIVEGTMTLRIGRDIGKGHGGRTRNLTPTQARLLAYALLSHAELLESRSN